MSWFINGSTGSEKFDIIMHVNVYVHISMVMKWINYFFQRKNVLNANMRWPSVCLAEKIFKLNNKIISF